MTLADFKTPGAELEGVHYLRNVEDADGLIVAMQACREAGGKVSTCSFVCVCSLHCFLTNVVLYIHWLPFL
jgi:hypothetical protein